MTLKEKRIKFLDDTIQHFSKNPRALTPGGDCLYSHSVNGGCAIGRHIDAELADDLDKCWEPEITSDYAFSRLPVNLRKLGMCFLYCVQILHDENKYWTPDGLSDKGKEFVNKIRVKYKLN